jgi:hypothetical protein
MGWDGLDWPGSGLVQVDGCCETEIWLRVSRYMEKSVIVLTRVSSILRNRSIGRLAEPLNM